MKKLIFISLVILFTLNSGAQQDPQFSQYMFNQMAINPGYAGSNDMICASLLNRQQWVGFTGAPSSTVFHVNAAVKPFGISSGVGLFIMNDQAGFNKNLNISGSYAYRLDLGPGKLGIGINIGMYNQSLEPEWFIPDSDHHTDVNGDPLIPVNSESVFVFDMGFGLFYKTDELYVGLSTTHLNEPKFKYSEGSPFLTRHYYFTAGYNFQLPNPLFEILPSIQILSDGATSEISLNANTLYNKKFWGGVSYKVGSAVVGMLGIQLFNGIKLGYAYEFPTSDIIQGTTGSHEFMVNYCFSLGMERSPRRYKSVRFL
ncbi:MAG: type IX secretion system membrane protein PorP/SprF [Bacteroidota bacterium]|nr:type IX secretion system membrane protein PorP/SprF [Bacteroidota bacterium]